MEEITQYRVAQIRLGAEAIIDEDFADRVFLNRPEKLFTCMNGLAFARGLLHRDHLQVPAIANMFVSMLIGPRFLITGQEYADRELLDNATYMGWLESERILAVQDIPAGHSYDFASKLHKWYCSMLLAAEIPRKVTLPSSALELGIQVLKM